MQLSVNKRAQECFYDTLQEGCVSKTRDSRKCVCEVSTQAVEKVTLSVFILSGTELKATARLEGPVAPLDTKNGIELKEAVDKFDNGKRMEGGAIAVNEVVDFEHLNDSLDEEEDEEDEEEETPIDPSDPDAEEKKKARRQKMRERFLEVKRKRERRKIARQRKIRHDGDPLLFTGSAPQAGWYRACLEGTWHQVNAELEMRKESELGGLDEDGHVITYEMKDMREEDEELEKDTASQEGIKDEDFVATTEKVKELRRLLNEIQSMQQKERRRLQVHAETNEHSHSRMVLGSLLETLLFMAVTGFQVLTIRRWFSGGPALGR
eukprot:scaffold1062_cov130-Cylindrotheca_fusiformis.AAC.9